MPRFRVSFFIRQNIILICTYIQKKYWKAEKKTPMLKSRFYFVFFLKLSIVYSPTCGPMMRFTGIFHPDPRVTMNCSWSYTNCVRNNSKNLSKRCVWFKITNQNIRRLNLSLNFSESVVKKQVLWLKISIHFG